MGTAKPIQRAIRLAQQLAEILEQIEAAPGSGAGELVPGKKLKPGPAPIVYWCRLDADPSKPGAILTFDDGSSVRLTPRLATIAAILKSVEGESPDSLVPWKSVSRIAQLMNSNPHAVRNLVGRFRVALDTAGIDKRRLVETAPRKGVRLRLKRQGP